MDFIKLKITDYIRPLYVASQSPPKDGEILIPKPTFTDLFDKIALNKQNTPYILDKNQYICVRKEFEEVVTLPKKFSYLDNTAIVNMTALRLFMYSIGTIYINGSQFVAKYRYLKKFGSRIIHLSVIK